jgi:hypothetical protein
MAELRRAVHRMLGKKHETANAEDDILFPTLAREKQLQALLVSIPGRRCELSHELILSEALPERLAS